MLFRSAILTLCIAATWPLAGQYTIEPMEPAPQSRITVLAMGGANFAWKSAAREGDTVSSYMNFAFGLQGWYRNIFDFEVAGIRAGLQPGLFAGITPIYRYTDTTTSKKSSDIKYPVIAEVRVMHATGMFLGAGGGWAYTVITNNDLKEASGSAAVISVLAGFETMIQYGIQVGFIVRGHYYLQQIESVNGTRTANNNFNLMPAIMVGYGF
jgi:hypothetical protein